MNTSEIMLGDIFAHYVQIFTQHPCTGRRYLDHQQTGRINGVLICLDFKA